jgi:hypothetical protein
MMDRDSSALSTARFAGCLPVVPLLQTLMVGSNTPHSTPLHGVHSAQHNKIAFNNQHAHNGLLQSVKVPLPLLPAGCKAAAGIYLYSKGSPPILLKFLSLRGLGITLVGPRCWDAAGSLG